MDENPYKSPLELATLDLASEDAGCKTIGWLRPAALVGSVLGYLICIVGPYWSHFDYFREPLALCFVVTAVGSLLFLLIRMSRIARPNSQVQ